MTWWYSTNIVEMKLFPCPTVGNECMREKEFGGPQEEKDSHRRKNDMGRTNME